MNALGVPFVLEGLLSEADVEAMAAEPGSELADEIGVVLEDDAEGAAATGDSGM
jgi:hypothetical protein